MVETLIERSADIRFDKMLSSIDIDSNFDIYIDDYYITSFDSIVNSDIDNVVSYFESQHNCTVSDDAIYELKEIKRSVKSAWNEEYEKFKVSYNENDFGQIHEIYIPIYVGEIDKIVLGEIYDSEGNFVADKLENKMGENLYKIETIDLYVDSVNKNLRNVYYKNNISFMDKLGIEKPMWKVISLYFIYSLFLVLPITVFPEISIDFMRVLFTIIWVSTLVIHPNIFLYVFGLPFLIVNGIYNYYIKGENVEFKNIQNV